jgi:hypothetical protein
MEQYVKRTQRDYSLSIIRQIEQSELTYIEATNSRITYQRTRSSASRCKAEGAII